MGSLVNTASNGKKFSFRACNVDGVMKHFDDWLIANMYVHNRGNNIVFDTGIYNNEYI